MHWVKTLLKKTTWNFRYSSRSNGISLYWLSTLSTWSSFEQKMSHLLLVYDLYFHFVRYLTIHTSFCSFIFWLSLNKFDTKHKRDVNFFYKVHFQVQTIVKIRTKIWTKWGYLIQFWQQWIIEIIPKHDLWKVEPYQ